MARWLVAGAVCIAALGGAVVAVRWGVAESAIALTERGPVPFPLIEYARAYQPSNPQTSYLIGMYKIDSAQPPDLEGAGTFLEEAVRMAPNRPEYWLALGRQREMTGRIDEAEQALRQAAAVAPYHWKPKWTLGNLYIRAGRIADAVTPLRVASELHPQMAPMAAKTIWDATGRGDVQLLQSVTGTSAAGRAAYVGLWTSEGKLDEALTRWNELVTEFGTLPVVAQTGMQLANALRAAGRGGDYADIVSRLNPERAAHMDTVANAGFDEPISESESSPFAWTVGRSAEARVFVDAGRTGGKALRIDYNSKGGASFQHVTQTVRVQPGVTYLLSAWAIAEKLASGGPPSISVADASGSAAVLGTVSVPVAATEWTQISVRFTAPPSGLVTVRIGRETCGPVCPIIGTVRFDDMALSR